MAPTTPSAADLPPHAYEDQRATVIGVVAFCLVWATALVGARMWTRGVIIKQLGVDDYMCVAGLLATYGSGIAVTHMTEHGLGRHIEVMKPEDISQYLRDFYVSIVLYCAALMFIKLAFIFQYYRVLAVQYMRYVYIGSIILVGGWGLSQVLVSIFICWPVAGFWDKTVAAKCIPSIPQWYTNAAGNILTDVAVFALPLPALWKLHLPRASKLVLIGIFSLGFFTVIISIIRIKYLRQLDDFPWENVASSLWSIGELTSALTCAVLPTLRPLTIQYFPRFASLIGRASSRGYAEAGSGGGAGANTRQRQNGGAWDPSSSATLGSGARDARDKGRRGSALQESRGSDRTLTQSASEVELAPSKSKSDFLDVLVVHELSVGVERESLTDRDPCSFGPQGGVATGGERA
ncbi:hypothetical protein VTI28DRAFT_7936 [Corynascus sepedonium]